MRRLARHLFTLCSAVSLLLCVAVCVLWVRQLNRSDTLAEWHWGGRRYTIVSQGGQVVLWARHPIPRGTISFPRFAFQHLTALLMLMALPGGLAGEYAITAARTRLASRSRGLCLTCGYDLRASPERCPECGTLAGVKEST